MITDTIGLLPIFNLLTGHSYVVTLVICFIISPVMLYLIGIIGESRFVPILPRKQFLSFMPGDIFTAWGTANLLVMSQKLPNGIFWYNNLMFHLIILIGAIIAAILITHGELNPEPGAISYKRRAVLSPTKIYHNLGLYGLYGYIIITTFVACAAGGINFWTIIKAVSPFLIWIIFLLTEGKVTRKTKLLRVNNAHVYDWQPLWVTLRKK